MFATFIFALVATITPGPNNIMLMSSGSTYGYIKTLPLLVGIVSGFMAMFISVGFGFSVVFKLYPYSLIIIKYIGFAYLIYLSWKIATTDTQAINSDKSRVGFLSIFFFQWLNPKSWIVVTSSLGAYVKPEGSYAYQVMQIIFIFFIAALISSNTWVGFGQFLKRWLNNANRQKLFNRAMALLLIATILPAIIESVRHTIIY